MGRIRGCIGCGYCCFKAKCIAGMIEFPSGYDRCPGLIWDEVKKRHFCKLILDSDKYSEELAIGEGCCMSLNSWRREELEDRT